MLRRIFDGISTVGNYIAGVFLAIVMWLTVGEITGRYLFRAPIPGNFEIIALSMGVLTTIGFAFALEQGRHIRALVLVERFRPKAQHVLAMANYFVGFIVTGVLAWQLLVGALASIKRLEYTAGLLPIPIYPTKVIIFYSVVVFCLGFILHFIWGIRRQR